MSKRKKSVSRDAIVTLALAAISKLESNPTCYCRDVGERCFSCETVDAINEVREKCEFSAAAPPPLTRFEDRKKETA